MKPDFDEPNYYQVSAAPDTPDFWVIWAENNQRDWVVKTKRDGKKAEEVLKTHSRRRARRAVDELAEKLTEIDNGRLSGIILTEVEEG